MIKLIKKTLPASFKRRIREVLLKSITPEKERLVGMTSPKEQLWYTQIAKEVSQMDGAVVDLGSWMGSTAISLGKGLQSSNYAKKGEEKPVYAIDRYIWESWMNSYLKFLFCDYVPGDSFLPEVRRRFATSGTKIVPIQTDLTKFSWDGGEISILLVDAMKSNQLCIAIAREFYPKLNEGSILIHQDFKHFYCPWIHLLQYSLRDYFIHFHDVSGTATTSFKVKTRIPNEVIQGTIKYEDVTDQEISEAFQYSMDLVGKDDRPNIAASHVMHFLNSNRISEASKVLESYCKTHGKVGELIKVGNLITSKLG